MSGAKEVAALAVDNIEPLLTDMFDGDYADNEVSLGELQSGNEVIQVQLKITRIPRDFVDTDYADPEKSFKSINETDYLTHV
ncbi:hypothetical protein [Pseudoalteromonas sp. BDTF-M6]|uniref:hypothetical protein n=1 Tax=Pseudoalteromonas sp. BDTF-M6 TaxID=2796132 RepID=UPI001BAFACE9|nr:hypothetical protein [Pseudoalteromonas sp. BDTF-M6]MBS3796701.1 hypothetical protein [Pseudoalteromonas sp. BDTF-M6]